MENPFKTGHWKGREIQAIDAGSRIAMARGFTLEQCRDALSLHGGGQVTLQKTVIEALHRRVRKLVGQEVR